MLKIENKGTLSLKYLARMDVIEEVVGKTKSGEEIKLSEILQVSTLTQQANAIGDIAVGLAFNGKNSVGYETTAAFNASNILKKDLELQQGDAQYLFIKVEMPETVGNEANHDGVNKPSIKFGINVLATQSNTESDSFGNKYDEEAVYPVANIGELQAAINNVVNGDVIQFSSDIEGDLVIPQSANTKFVIDGNGSKFAGTILVDGKSATLTTAGITIKNVEFTAATADACIQLGKDNNTRYTCNVTIENCTFAAPEKVGIKSYTGGDKNLTIKNCVATSEAHSLAQLKGVDGVLVEGCEINSTRGINFNNSTNVTIDNCTFDVQKYAVRFGEGSAATGAAETYLIKNSTIKSANVEDATIVLRGTADLATLTIENCTIVGNPEIDNSAVDAKVVK